MGDSLKNKTAQGLFWGLINNGTQQLLNLLFGIFLARLLEPSDYGMVGMLTIFSLIAASLQESGFTVALAKKAEVTSKDYNAVFWFSSGLSFCMYWILFFSAPLIADFYKTTELIPLSRYLFIGFFISSLSMVPSAYMFRNMQVKQKALATFVALAVSGTVGIILAYNGFSYWGIATQSIVYILTLTIIYWFLCPWRPSFNIDFSPIKEMIGFSSKLLFTNIFIHLNNNIFSIVLGRYYTENEVGQYNQANKWNYMGHSLISGMVGSVALPMFSQISDDTERQRRAFRKMLRFTSFISFPAMFGLALIAPEMITIMITDKWLPSALILQVLAIGGAFLPIVSLYSNLLMSKGKSDIYLWNTVVLGLLQLALILLLYPYGIAMMIKAYVALNVLWLLVWHYFLFKEIRLPLIHALKDIGAFAVIAFFVMLATWYVTKAIENIYILITAKILVASLLYVMVMWLSRSVTFKECLGYLLKKNR